MPGSVIVGCARTPIGKLSGVEPRTIGESAGRAYGNRG
jgi:hypothetical protein